MKYTVQLRHYLHPDLEVVFKGVQGDTPDEAAQNARHRLIGSNLYVVVATLVE